jgi:hypothetical protein
MLNPMEVEDTVFSFSQQAPLPSERRRDRRHVKMLRVGTLNVGSRTELCLIRNISAGGLLAHVYSSLELGQRVSVSLKSAHVLEGEVIWLEDGNAGIQFDQPIDVEEMLSSPTLTENGWLPRMPRVEVDWLATVRAGARTCWVSLRDISQGGVKLESDEPLTVGDQVVLTIDKFRSVRGVVRWWDDGLGGIAFDEIIPFHELMRWLRAH